MSLVAGRWHLWRGLSAETRSAYATTESFVLVENYETLDHAREKLRLKSYASETEKSYVGWIKYLNRTKE